MSVPSEKEKPSKPARKKHSLKVVLRRLPYAMCEEELMEQLDPFPATIRRRWFCQADPELLPFAFSRAYFIFEDETEAITFCERFNGYVFVDKQGNESVAIAEQAPSAMIPNKNSKERDKRMNTLESDSEYLKFLEMYNNSTVKKVTDFDGLLKELEKKRMITNFIKSTPLTEFLEKQSMNKPLRKKCSTKRPNVLNNVPSVEKVTTEPTEKSKDARRDLRNNTSEKSPWRLSRVQKTAIMSYLDVPESKKLLVAGKEEVPKEVVAGKLDVRNRKRRPRLPKNIDPNMPAPDPERVLPQQERSAYKKKLNKNFKDRDIVRGTQGSSAAAAPLASSSSAAPNLDIKAGSSVEQSPKPTKAPRQPRPAAQRRPRKKKEETVEK